MTTHTENHQLDSELTLRDSSDSPLTVRTVSLSLTKQESQLIECRLTLSINPSLYHHIDTNALFNLKPEVRRTFINQFQSSPDIKIEITLKPDLLPQLIEHSTEPNQTATYLLNLRGEKPGHPLLFTENWLALSVKQPQESGEIGYSTLWHSLNPSVLASGATSREEIGNAITSFFQEWTEVNLSAMSDKTTSEIMDGIANLFQGLADVSVNAIAIATCSRGKIYQEMVNFFQQDEWPFYPVEGQPVLQTAFEGKNGKWPCFARAREQQQQMVFYSIFPVNVPEHKLMAVAEFLTRANSGMILGNFELNFTEGEMSYKTSIDVEGDRLSFALIKRLVYANVTMMDEYWPGIMSVIYGGVEVREAIASIES
jgi:hypothetical protein